MKLERKFEKELAGDLRKETADKLREVCKKPASFAKLKDRGTKELPEEYKKYYEAEESFETLKNSIWGKIFKTEKYKKQELILNQILEHLKQRDIEEVREEYNKKFKEILKNCPLSLEEREKYLSTEAMEKMSLDDYLILLKRLSGEAFYHVTRYGVRENTFMSTGGGHIEGKDSFIDSLTPLLKDGNIQSATSSIIKDHNRARSIVNKEAVEKLKKKENQKKR